MKNRYFLIDFGAAGEASKYSTLTARDAAALRCGKFTSIDRAKRELNAAVGGPDRWRLFDRDTLELIEPDRERTRMALGRDDEQSECRLISGEVVR